ncbi:MAG: hypothetical protein A3C85_04210 [Candidatus Doudnabacteria bacterium RIFCSPHIGHO2_02_FULL_48_21]|uniref:Uncharacterized protein n=1 Tax=Candidatus Doudnabacteria bacterium RIFCSPLOWO2_02_FULL_48_13 TaxID=1817845 RepID=A0A1F5QA56_9BACT|nr:MAG: hypothetical protein A3K05_00895 [Candidatus Doudnabacteria bacterium RIFCSPHIGHO2_01_48_18]OGE78866.1 MAG: hypothetical protein A2668_00610 [Candidatus Doudnabacteria bacterium RIFCSPHIGHO2_01_FULL_48_180]OGE91857.1 MAG: hypothetical protein A3F44_04290 [Candidatus Doudnabacteria bacterium RIFCSPHIGHO2_12_FULL_47_25]OGE94094.1 MAG: hypothetical protein A3C85_04210 [Candidatus Doudnabacteria bacterium RIFCSPHIGHO2_02_FULL_48_21]OGE98200.1 MAG: hypothetical protein A3A83_03465 [Candidatu
MSEQRHESSKKINWGIVGFMAGLFPSALAIFFVFIPAIRSAGWVIAAVVIGFFSMAFSLILSIVAHAKDMDGKHWSLFGVCVLPLPFVVLVIVSALVK